MADSISFARGAPSLDIIDIEGLKASATESFSEDPGGVTAYGTAGGYAPLRKWIAERHGVGVDQVIVTNDNPRSEEPRTIASQILLGMTGYLSVAVELDRAQAIAQAIAQARPQDVVLVSARLKLHAGPRKIVRAATAPAAAKLAEARTGIVAKPG